MKSKCQWPDCGQKIEHDDLMANTKCICPTCNRETYLIPEINLKSFILGLKSILTPLYSIYFDTNAVNPKSSSPYKFVLSFARAIYLVFAAWLLLALVFVLLQLDLSPTGHGGEGNGFAFIADHPRILGGASLFCMWLFIYWGYKITRVIFDIAEYLRQIAAK